MRATAHPDCQLFEAVRRFTFACLPVGAGPALLSLFLCEGVFLRLMKSLIVLDAAFSAMASNSVAKALLCGTLSRDINSGTIASANQSPVAGDSCTV